MRASPNRLVSLSAVNQRTCHTNVTIKIVPVACRRIAAARTRLSSDFLLKILLAVLLPMSHAISPRAAIFGREPKRERLRKEQVRQST